MRNAVFPHYKSVHLTTYVKGEIGLGPKYYFRTIEINFTGLSRKGK